MTLIERIIRIEEGRLHDAYPDPLTHGAPWTIGEGHTGPEVHEGLVWSDAQIDATKASDILAASNGCLAHFSPWFLALDEVRRAILVAMAFQLGMPRLLQFQHFLGYMRDQQWNQAAGEIRNSLWHKETYLRAERCARGIETGGTQWG